MSRAKELVDAATPLPWSTETRTDYRMQGTLKIARILGGEPLSEKYWPLRTDPPMKRVMEQESWYVFPKEADLALIEYAVNRLPDYEAAVEALERAVPLINDEWEGTGKDSVGNEWLRDARAALRRLRDEVPA